MRQIQRDIVSYKGDRVPRLAILCRDRSPSLMTIVGGEGQRKWDSQDEIDLPPLPSSMKMVWIGGEDAWFGKV